MALQSIENIILRLIENEALILTIGGLAILSYFLFKKYEENKGFEQKEPSEITRAYIKNLLENTEKVEKTLKDEKGDKGIIDRGTIIYEYLDKMPEDVIRPAIDPDQDPGQVDVIHDIMLFKVIPESSSKLKYWIEDVILGKDNIAEYYSLKKENLKYYNDEIVIKDGVFLDYDRGVFTDRSQASKNEGNHAIRLDTQNELVKGHMNYAQRVVHLDPNHTKDTDKIEASKEETIER